MSSSLDRKKILAGEPVTLRINLRWRPPVQVPSVILAEEKIGNFQVLSNKSSQDKEDGGYQQREVFIQLASFEIGPNQLPSIVVPYTNREGKIVEAKTQTYSVEVASYLDQLKTGKNTAPRPMKDPIYWRLSNRTLMLLVAICLLAVLLAAFLLWHIRRYRRRHPKIVPVTPPLPPDEEALQALAELEMSGMVDREAAKQYYIRLSEILRRYLGRRYQIDAPEMTSSELLEKAEHLGWNNGVYQLLTEDVAESDSVKFAKYIPSRPMREAALHRARQIVMDTRPTPEPEESIKTPKSENDEKSNIA